MTPSQMSVSIRRNFSRLSKEDQVFAKGRFPEACNIVDLHTDGLVVPLMASLRVLRELRWFIAKKLPRLTKPS